MSVRYSILLESYKGMTVNNLVYQDGSPWTGTLEEASKELASWNARNPGGVYKLVQVNTPESDVATNAPPGVGWHERLMQDDD